MPVIKVTVPKVLSSDVRGLDPCSYFWFTAFKLCIQYTLLAYVFNETRDVITR